MTGVELPSPSADRDERQAQLKQLVQALVFDPNPADWKLIQQKINKFLWNKHYANNTAPPRIKKATLLTPIIRGGFGMIDLAEVATTLRLRRHFSLTGEVIHPMSELIRKLMIGTSYLSGGPILDLDEIVTLNMHVLRAKRIKDCDAQEWQLESDLVLHANLLDVNVRDLTRPRKIQGNELRTLQRRGINTLREIVITQNMNLQILRNIALKELLTVINVIARFYRDTPLPNADESQQHKLRGLQGRWICPKTISARVLREIFFGRGIASPKITIIEHDEGMAYFSNLSKIGSVVNKLKILRLLQGDVYCNDRLYCFGLSEIDSCKRCFEKETILHLLSECPYTMAVYDILNIDTNDINEILGINLGKGSLEIRCDIISYIVFRHHTMPPEILVKTTLEKYAKGLANKPGVQKVAKTLLRQIFGEDI